MQELSDKAKIEFAKEFLAGKKLMVISTVNARGLSESAVVGFAETDDFEIIFGTFAGSRKYRNLQTNPFVSLVAGWEMGQTVQLEGRAEEIKDPAEIKKCIEVYLAKSPSVAKFVEREEERFFKIKPTWLRYSNLSVDPWDIFEINF